MALEHFAKVKRAFLAYLRRPDSKQQALTSFQLEYNTVDADLRRLPEAKGELLLRAEELRDALWDTCDVKLEENQAEALAATSPAWVQDHRCAGAGAGVPVLELVLVFVLAPVRLPRLSG